VLSTEFRFLIKDKGYSVLGTSHFKVYPSYSEPKRSPFPSSKLIPVEFADISLLFIGTDKIF
jgi:hypothetical protein